MLLYQDDEKDIEGRVNSGNRIINKNAHSLNGLTAAISENTYKGLQALKNLNFQQIKIVFIYLYILYTTY